MSPALSARPAGRHDQMARRQSKRSGKERGCWIYLAAEELDRTGFGGDTPAPAYRVWPAPRGRVAVQLYRGK